MSLESILRRSQITNTITPKDNLKSTQWKLQGEFYVYRLLESLFRLPLYYL